MTPRAVTWIENNFYIPETRADPHLNGRIGLQTYQRDVLNEALTPDKDGKFKYSIIVWSDIKKSAKSTIAAAMTLYRATFTEFGEFYVIANDLKQADSRVAHYIRRAVELNPKMRKKYKQLGYRITAPSGSYIEAIPIDPSGEAGTNADCVLFSELWGAHEEDKNKMWCLDDQTEVLTRNGFKFGLNLSLDDEIAVYQNGDVFWEKPYGIFNQPFSGKLHTYEHKHFSLWCTEDHRLVGKYSLSGTTKLRNGDFYGVFPSNELRKLKINYYHPIMTVDEVDHSVFEHPDIVIPKTKFKDEKKILWKKWVAFLGLYLTEGSTSDFRGVPCKVRIFQLRKPHPDKYDEILNILRDCFGDWTLVNKYDGFTIASTEVSKLTKSFGTTWQKRVPREIIESSPDVLETFLHSYILGDGTIKEDGSFSICCASSGMADDIQEIAFRLGYRVSKRPHMNKYWRVYLSPKNGETTVLVEKKHWKEREYSGRVWCPSVSTGMFVARRDGWIFITGNSEMTLSPTKYGHSFRWIESYAGFMEESDLLYSLYELGVKQGELLWPDRVYNVTEGPPTQLELYVNKSAGMLCLWNTQPRCPWQTREYYESEEKILPPGQFLRLHRNQWVSNTETFVPMEWWYSCRRSPEEWPVIDNDRHPVVVAMDAATSNDNFGIWAGSRHPQFHDEVITLFAQKWAPNKFTGKIDFQGTEEHPGPERALRTLVERYNVIQICYDPFQLHDMSMRLKQEGLAWLKAFNQGADRLLADSQFRDLIRDRRFWHRGEPDLTEHVQNANAKLDDQDSRIRLVKRVDRLKIDLAVAASMGSYTLLYLNL